MNPSDDEQPLDWGATRDTPLGSPAAPVSGPVTGPIVPYEPPQPYHPPPAAYPQPNVTYVQPVARHGITGPQAAVLIAVLLVVLPVLCCLGAMMVGMIGGAGANSSP